MATGIPLDMQMPKNVSVKVDVAVDVARILWVLALIVWIVAT